MSEISGSILKEERKKRSLSQKDLAARLSISPAYVNLIENGNRPLTTQLRRQICEILEIQESRILGEANIEQLRALQNSEHFRDFSADDLQRLVIEMPAMVNVILTIEAALAQSRNTLSRLSNRVGQDERLSNNLHELLSIATSIRSTSSILNTQGDIAAEHSNRFRDILHQDARQLSETLRGLVDYLDKGSQDDASRVQSELRLIQYLEDRQYYVQALENGKLDAGDLQDWLAQEFGEELATNGKVNRLFSLFHRDVEALPRDEFLEVAERNNWSLDAIAIHFDAPMDRVLRRVAMLSRFAKLGSVSLYMQDQTGHFLLESLTLSGYRDVELSCPFWPIFDAERERGKLFASGLYLSESEPIYAYAASALHSSMDLPQGGWIYRTMLVTRGGAEARLAKIEMEHRRIGFNCQDCRILDCGARRNGAISLINNKPNGEPN